MMDGVRKSEEQDRAGMEGMEFNNKNNYFSRFSLESSHRENISICGSNIWRNLPQIRHFRRLPPPPPPLAAVGKRLHSNYFSHRLLFPLACRISKARQEERKEEKSNPEFESINLWRRKEVCFSLPGPAFFCLQSITMRPRRPAER